MKQRITIEVDVPDGYRPTGEYRFRKECEAYIHGPNGESVPRTPDRIAGAFPVIILEPISKEHS